MRLEDYRINMQKKKEKFRIQKENTLHNAREFYKGRKIILIAFENNAFLVPKQYPSDNVDDWKEDGIDSTHIIPGKTDELLPLVMRRKKLKKKKCLKRCSKKNVILLMRLMNLFLK